MSSIGAESYPLRDFSAAEPIAARPTSRRPRRSVHRAAPHGAGHREYDCRGAWKGDVGELLPSGFSPEYQPRNRFLSTAELARLLAQLLPDHAARVAFIVGTSACWSATERARREYVAPDHAFVFVDGTKRRTRQRHVPIVTDLQRTLLDYALTHAQSQDGMFEPWRRAPGSSTRLFFFPPSATSFMTCQ